MLALKKGLMMLKLYRYKDFIFIQQALSSAIERVISALCDRIPGYSGKEG